MIEERIQSRHAPAKDRVIDRVVVDQCCEMNELHRGGECNGCGIGPVLDAAREQNECWTKHLAAHGHQMRADLRDQRDVGGYCAPHLLCHGVEPLTYWLLDALESSEL